MIFENRIEAGRVLGQRVAAIGELTDPLVLGLPRGGVPVAAEVARAIGAPLDVLVVRKLGSPGNPEFAVGAIGPGGVKVVDARAMRATGTSEEALDRIRQRELDELERREQRYRAGRPPLALLGRTAVIVDDGIATGATAMAASLAARGLGASRIILAAPVAPAGWRDELTQEPGAPDDVVIVSEPTAFWAVGQWYRDFRQTTDDEVVAALADAD